MRKQRPGTRVLAIDLTARGFGFVVVEDGDRLVDWGLRDIREEKEQRTIEKLEDLLRLYRLSTLVLEDVDDLSSRRSPRIQRMVRLVGGFAVQAGVAPRAVAPAQVRACFARLGASTKHQIAGVICGRFPELVSYRPPRRRLWMSEDERMAIFDAASLAATFFVWSQ